MKLEGNRAPQKEKLSLIIFSEVTFLNINPNDSLQ